MRETNTWLALSKVTLDNDPFDQTITITCNDLDHIHYGLDHGTFTLTYDDGKIHEVHEIFLGSTTQLGDPITVQDDSTIILNYEEID